MADGLLLLGTVRPSKVIAKALSAGLHRVTQRARPRPVGSSARVTNSGISSTTLSVIRMIVSLLTFAP